MTFSSHAVLRTKIIPPSPGPRTLGRSRVTQIILNSLQYRLTILQAGPGYGKSTALSQLTSEPILLIWYQVNEEDADPLTFLSHLFQAAGHALPELGDSLKNSLYELFDNWNKISMPIPWRSGIDQFINLISTYLDSISSRENNQILFILDDAHLVSENGEVPFILDRLIGLAPTSFHLLLSGRPTISLPNLSRWRAQGAVLFIDQRILEFTNTEIEALFEFHYQMNLNAEEIESISKFTEGWAIALQLVWQNLRGQKYQKPEHGRIAEKMFQLDRGTTSLEVLFEVLAREIFQIQPADVQEFLLSTAILRDLEPLICDELRMKSDSSLMMAYLKRQELFVIETAPNRLRYHHIFHSFLRQLTPVQLRDEWHHTAAKIFQKRNNSEGAIYHLLESKDWEATAELLDTYSIVLLNSGRLDTLSSYILSLPPDILVNHPTLVFNLGELARLHSRFDEALGWYKQAEMTWRNQRQKDGIARALRGQARVYLDTVNPAQAEKVLEEAIYLSDGFEDRDSQIRLFELLSENKLNAGQISEAERLRHRADSLRLEGPTKSQLWFRVLLRTGRLNEARRELEETAETERSKPVQTPRAHRETILILSLIYSFMGLSSEAYQASQEGIQRGIELKSPFITAVGHMRQGHALQLLTGSYFRTLNENGNDQDEFSSSNIAAAKAFDKCVELSRSLNVSRLLVEANWGLCRLAGYQGDLSNALAYANTAIEIANQAGDEWIASMTRLTLGASYALAGQYDQSELWLSQASAGFEECSDPFGLTAVRLWLCYTWLKQKETKTPVPNSAKSSGVNLLLEVLRNCQEFGYDFLFLRPSLLGPPDERIFIPLLLYARNLQENAYTKTAIYINQLLQRLGLQDVELHPGYKLRVQTLGTFQVWRGTDVIPSSGWRREKAKILFQLLLSFQKVSLDREQICEFLWPEADPDAAQRNFKITLNTLFQVLEPGRKPGSESAYITREGTVYSLRPSADIFIDSVSFSHSAKSWIQQAMIYSQSKSPSTSGLLSEGLHIVNLYTGEFLPETIYETWAAEERERLATLFMQAADRLAELLILNKDYKPAIDVCQRILAQDNCWERAYRYLMIAYSHIGEHGQLGRTYQRCVQTLRSELDIAPAPETQTLYEQLI